MKPPTPVSVSGKQKPADGPAGSAVNSAGETPAQHARSAPTVGAAGPHARWQVVNASPGDHPLIHQFLVSVFQSPSPTEFQAQLEEPSYEPRDRLLIKSEERILSHVRLLRREMRFGETDLPVGILTGVATRPEYQRQGCGTALLSRACQTLNQEGVVLALLSTPQPRFYAGRGWVINGRHCYSASPPRRILAYLKQREAELSRRQEPLPAIQDPKQYNIQLWRHMERAAVMQLYQQNMQNSHGSLVRSEALLAVAA